MTNRARLSLLYCFTTLVLTALNGPVRGAEDRDITIVPEPVLPNDGSSAGYVEYRFKVTNRSVDKTHQVTLKLSSPGYVTGQTAHLRSLTRTERIPPMTAVTVSLFHPNLYLISRNSVEATVDGKVLPDPIGLPGTQVRGKHLGKGNYAYFEPGSPPNKPPTTTLQMLNYDPCILVSSRVQGNGANISIKSGNIPIPPGSDPKTARSFFGPSYHYNVAASPITEWSTNWLAYSCYDGILLTAAELTHLEDPGLAEGKEIQEALWRYVEAGGCLVIAGSWQVKIPQPWQRWRITIHGLETYYVGFGRCFVLPGGNLQQLRQEQCYELVGAWLQSQNPWGNIRSIEEANKSFPIVDSIAPPLRGLFALMVIFCLVIGPGNYVVLSRCKRKIWILWTVPVISLATSVAVIGYVFAAEGWQGQFRLDGLTILDEANQRATTIGLTAFYSPMATDGLHFGYHTELTPQNADRGSGSTPHGTASTPVDLDWSKDHQHLLSGWLIPRIPAHFMVRKSETRTERLLVKDDKDGGMTLVNRLGADIRQLWLADKEGRIYTGASIPVDGEAVLQPTTQRLEPTPNLAGLRSAFGQDWVGHVQLFTAEPRKFLLPGTYIALLEDEPFIEEGLRNAKKKQCTAVVYGIMSP